MKDFSKPIGKEAIQRMWSDAFKMKKENPYIPLDSIFDLLEIPEHIQQGFFVKILRDVESGKCRVYEGKCAS